MSREHVNHREIAAFAQDKVNLPKEWADGYRAQARRLRERLETYLDEHPDFTLKRMQVSGSLAKGTALRTLNDIDVACYVSGANAPQQVSELLEYIAERLRKAFPNFSPDQVVPQTYSVTVSFRGSGLDVDIVPILYDGDPTMVWQPCQSGRRVVPENEHSSASRFLRQAEEGSGEAFLAGCKAREVLGAPHEAEQDGFRFKSFMIELILARLCDQGLDLSDYPDALQHFFGYVAKSRLREKIVFTDCYAASKVGSFSEPVQIIDPVNELNNVSRLYTGTNADLIVEAALDAGDAIDAALYAPTKQETVRYWQKVFGPSFQV